MNYTLMSRGSMDILEIRDSNLDLLALVIRANAKADGVHFLTEPEKEMQLGLMTRGVNEPVQLHKHNSVSRNILGTQEVLLIRSGRAKVSVWGEDFETNHVFTLEKGDVVLLLKGAHQIEFLETTELLEIKQGPYIAHLDKTYL